MRQEKRWNRAYRRLFGRGADNRQKSFFARWMVQLDLSGGKVFADEREEAEIRDRMQRNLHRYYVKHTEHAERPVRHLLPWLSAAAALLITVGVVWYSGRKEPIAVEPQLAEFSTGMSERKILSLPDGSRITLNTSSTIRIPQPFADTLREVTVSGEAFFEVAKDNARPFIVRSGQVTIQVLGTSFNVWDFDKGDADVVVTAGKVRVQAGNDDSRSWELGAGDRLVYDALSGKAEQGRTAAAEHTAWLEGRMVFRDELMERICRRLEQRYGVTIHIRTPALHAEKLTLKLKDESLEQVLDMLSSAGEFRYRIAGQHVAIWK